MIRTLQAFDIKGKNVLIRADLNVPMSGETITNNFRIKSSLPTIKRCIEAGASVVLMSHLGRPKGKEEQSLSLIPVGEELAGLLEMPIKFSANCISTDAIDTSILKDLYHLNNGSVLLKIISAYFLSKIVFFFVLSKQSIDGKLYIIL